MSPRWLSIGLALSVANVAAQEPSPPLWLTEARQKITAIAAEVARDDALFKTQIEAVDNAGPFPEVRVAALALGATPAELDATDADRVRADLRIGWPGGNFWENLFERLDWLMKDEPARDPANSAPPRDGPPDEARVRHLVTVAEADFAEWRAVRGKARAALVELGQAARRQEALAWYAAVASARSSGAKVTRANTWAMRDALDAAVSAGWVARVRSDRFVDLAGRPAFFPLSFWADTPPALAAMPAGERIARAPALDRLDALAERIAATRLSVLELAGRPGRGPFDEVIRLLTLAEGPLREWRGAFLRVFDCDPREIDVLATAAAASLREAETLLEPARGVVAENLRARGLEPAQEERRSAEEKAGAESAAFAQAGNDGGAALKNAERARIANERTSIENDVAARWGKAQGEFAAALSQAEARIKQSWPKAPENRVAAIRVAPRRENQGMPWGAGVSEFSPYFQHAAAGVALSVVLSYSAGYPPSEPARVKVTLGERSATVVDTRVGIDFVPPPKVGEAFVLVSAAADRAMSAPPPRPMTTERKPAAQPQPKKAATSAVRSPIAGSWQVAYFDARLGWVRGRARVAGDYGGATLTLRHPQTKDEMNLIASAPREEGGNRFVFEFRGASPGPVPGVAENYSIGEAGVVQVRAAVGWEEFSRDGRFVATEPLPAGLPRLVVPPTASTLEFEVEGARFSLKLPPLGTPPAEPVLTLRLLRWTSADDNGQLHHWKEKTRALRADDREVDEWLAGSWETPVDPATRQPVEGAGRTLLLRRDASDPAQVRAIGEEIWWREAERAKWQLLAQTAAGPIVVQRFFLGMPTVIEAMFDEPQGDEEKSIELQLEGRKQIVTLHRYEQDWARFLSDPILPGDRPATTERRTP